MKILLSRDRSSQKAVGLLQVNLGVPHRFRGLVRTRRKNLALRAFRVKMLETGVAEFLRHWRRIAT